MTSKTPSDEDIWRSDPHKGRFGGSRVDETHHLRVFVKPIRSLAADPDLFWLPLIVESTDPENHPLADGEEVTFHLHPTFSPDEVTVIAKNGVAKKTLTANSGFTVGVSTSTGALMEIDLCDADINAPDEFKEG